MQSNNNAQRKRWAQLPAAEAERRRQQSNRDKAAARKTAAQRLPAPVRALRKPTENIELLGAALATPSEVKPIRFPSTSGLMTDVLACTISGTHRPPTGYSAPLTHSLSPLFGTALGQNDGLAIVTRDPAAPLYLTRASPVNPMAGTWEFSQDDLATVEGVGIHPNYYIIPSMEKVLEVPATGATDTDRYLDDSEDHLLAPSVISHLFHNPPGSTFQANVTGFTDNLIGNVTPVAYADGSTWGWYGGGFFRVAISGQKTSSTATMGVNSIVTIQLERFLDTESPDVDVQGPFQLTVTGSMDRNSAAVLNVVPTDCRPGWYRFRITNIRYAKVDGPGTTFVPSLYVSVYWVLPGRHEDLASTYNYPNTGPSSTVTWSGVSADTPIGMYYYLWPCSTTLHIGGSNQAAHLWQNCRINAVSFLLKNTSAVDAQTGEVRIARLPPGVGIHDFTTDTILAVSTQRRMYVGPLSQGAYTWLESPGADVPFRPATTTVQQIFGGKNRTLIRPTVRLDMGITHVVLWRGAAETSVLPPQTFTFRCDFHLEYVSDSPLATNAMTPLMTSDLELASKALAGAPLGTENWIHLEQIWKALKGGAIAVGKAGASAAASAAMRELIALLSAVVI